MDKKLIFYIIKRVLLAAVTVLLVITITFFVMHAIPGNPFLSEKNPSPEVLEALNQKYGLDKPLFVQYLKYLEGVLHGDFGTSIKYRKGQDVSDIIFNGFAVSAPIGLIAAAAALVLGIVFGAIAAVYHDKIGDKVIMVVSTAFVAMPSFIVATFLRVLFCDLWGVFPPDGATTAGLVLPIISLALYPMSYIIRLTRSSMLDVLGQDYIRTAKAKGVRPSKVLFKHALRNAVTPVVTYAGPMIANILTGSIVVEQIFNVKGLGYPFIESIAPRDYPVIMGTTIFLATIVVIMMLVSDILYKVFDPRVDLS